MVKNRIKNFFALIFNLAIVGLVIYSVLCYFNKLGTGTADVSGVKCFQYFTIDSNILLAVTTLFIIPCNVGTLLTGENRNKNWAVVIKYIGTVAVAVTLTMVLAYLGPTKGFDSMFVGNNLFLHLVCPALAIFSFMFLETNVRVNFANSLFSILPVLIYGAIYIYLVFFKEIWVDFYGLNLMLNWYYMAGIIVVGTYILGAILLLIRNLLSKRKDKITNEKLAESKTNNITKTDTLNKRTTLKTTKTSSIKKNK